ncbi:MAG: STAS domain-containing protein [Planctomycetales bacterium]|nr:STAS domain-containing protein [Planctomycetales bacterium]
MAELIDAHAFVVQFDHGVVVVRLVVESLVDEQRIEELETRVNALLSEADVALVLDCQNVCGAVSSRFVGLMVTLYRRAVARHVTFAVCGLSGPLKEVFEITRLEGIIPTFNASRPAVREFGRFNKREQLRNEVEKQREAEEASPVRRIAAVLDPESVDVWRLAFLGAVCFVAVGWLGWQVGDFLLHDDRASSQGLERMERMR